MIFIPQSFTDKFCTEFLHCFGKRDQCAVIGDKMADTFIFAGQRTVVGRSCAAEPAFINAASFTAESIIVIGVEFDAASGDTKTAGNPVRSKTENAF